MRSTHRRRSHAAKRLLLRATALVAAAVHAPALVAQVDCGAGFNCGRVAAAEYVVADGTSRLWLQNLDGSQRSLLLEGDFDGTQFGGVTFDADSRKLYFQSRSSGFGTGIFRMDVDGSGLTDLTGDSCQNSQFELSPDGARIVFRRNCGPTDFDDKIWLMDVDGSDQRLLTTAAIVNGDPTGNKHASPDFSPGGDSVVFTSQDAAFGSRQVYRSSLDGATVVALTNSESDGFANNDPVYLPNGSIVFSSSRDAPSGLFNDLYRMNGDGGGRLRLTNIVGAKRDLVVSPDGTRVLFENIPDPDGFTIPPTLYIVGTDGSGLVALYEPEGESAGVGTARFSPDGTRIAYDVCYATAGNCRYATRVVNLDGSDPVIYDDPALNIPFRAFGRPDVDGDGVIDGADTCPLVANGYRVALDLALQDVWTINYDGTQPLRVTTSNASDKDPRFDATGRRIVFSSNRFSNDYEIFVMNADGTGVTRLTTTAGRDEGPVMSPDGTKVAFLGTRPPPAQNFDENVWIMNADGSDPVRLTTNQGFNGRAANPVFNHDGTRIAFDTVRDLLTGNNRDIYTIRTDGSDEIRLTTTAGIDAQASYSRDGASIVFISYRDGAATNGEIYVMRADGSDPRRITNTTAAESQPTFSPDGAQIVFMADYGGGSPKPHAMNRDGSGLRQITGSANFMRPTLAPQPDSDGDGVGDACDTSFDAATQTGTNVTTNAPAGSVTFPQVTDAGTTSFQPITVAPGDLPAGFALCASCPAYEITTTAGYVPPIEVCLAVPAAVTQADFLALRLLHGENGIFVDRTTRRIDSPDGRYVCGEVASLSPFVLATFTAPPVEEIFGNGFE